MFIDGSTTEWESNIFEGTIKRFRRKSKQTLVRAKHSQVGEFSPKYVY
jgi:hypothetical protein